VSLILAPIGEPAAPPQISPALRPLVWDDEPGDALGDWGALAQPQPEYVFDQRDLW
jgi:hypothetical protein